MFPYTEDRVQTNSVSTATPIMGRTFLFDFSKGDFVMHDGNVVETEDIAVWVEKILRTEKYRYKVYENTDYGCQIEDLVIGTNFEAAFLESELKREVEDAILKHPKITEISKFEVERTAKGANVKLEVVLIDEGTDTVTIAF